MQLKLNDTEFQRNAGNVVKSLLKQNEIYTLEENDIKPDTGEEVGEDASKSKATEEDICPPSLACEICH